MVIMYMQYIYHIAIRRERRVMLSDTSIYRCRSMSASTSAAHFRAVVILLKVLVMVE